MIQSTRRRPLASNQVAERSPEALAHQVRSLLAEAQALSSRLASLNEIAATMQATLNLDTVLQTLARQARWLIDFEHCSVALREGAHYQLLTLHADGEPVREGLYSLAHGVLGHALQQGHEFLLHCLDAHAAAPTGSRSALIVPLRQGRETVGTLNFFSDRFNHYSQDDLRVAAALGLHVSVILQNTRLFNAVMRMRDELHTVLESIGDAVLVIDVRGRILLTNGSLCDLLKLPKHDFIGARALKLLRWAGSSQPLVSSNDLRQILAAQRVVPQPKSTGSLMFPDGRHVEWAAVPLAGTGTTGGTVITMRDVSARVELEQLRMDLTHTLVYDLRTPLSALLMGTEMLTYAKGEHAEAMREEVTARMRHSANQMIDHVNTILDVSKLEANQLILKREPQQLMLLVRDQIDQLQLIAEGSDQTITSVMTPFQPLVLIDTALIRRVIANLLGNALRFTPSGGHIRVDAGAAVTGDALEVRVTDSGPGVSEDMREQIFKKYVQVAGARQPKGTGLGLFFCKLAVEAHGGMIGVRPAPGGGSIFWFTLPLPDADNLALSVG